jgi:hypothetical protein
MGDDPEDTDETDGADDPDDANDPDDTDDPDDPDDPDEADDELDTWHSVGDGTLTGRLLSGARAASNRSGTARAGVR